MKVLHVETGMHLYGGALQVYFLLRELSRREEDQHILVCSRGSAIAEECRQLNVQVVELPMGGDLDLPFLLRLRAVIRRERPDLVHLHSRRGAEIMGALAARSAGVPVVLSRRVDNPEPAWLASRKYRLYDRVITISDGIRQVLISEGVPASRIECVPSAVDTEQYKPGCLDRAWFEQEFDLEPGSRTVGMIAQFIPRKGHKVLLEAVPMILEAVPDTHFLLFGKGPEEETIQAEVDRLGLNDAVRFCGFRDDLHRVLPCLDAVAHPAYMEGLGVSLLQAAACGIPIVACRAGGMPEVVGDGENGLLIEPGDADGLASALAGILGDAHRARDMGNKGRERVQGRFSIAAMAAGNREIHKRLVEQ